MSYFCTSLPNQIEHTWLKSQVYVCKHEWPRILFVDGVLTKNSKNHGSCKISWKKPKTSHSNHVDHTKDIEDDIM
jgi:hypothetical protein